MRDKGLTKIGTSVFEGWRAAKVRGVSLYQDGIEAVLADEHAQPVSQLRLTVIRAVLMRRLYCLVLFPRGARRPGKPAQLLNRTQPDAVGLAQRTIDSSGFGHAHFSAADHGSCICGVGVTIADETLRISRLVDGRLEDPAVGRRVAELPHSVHLDTDAAFL